MKNSLLAIFAIFLKLGCISFGGPIAHLGFFHREFVQRRHWIDEKTYLDLITLCQTLPGPASSQVAISLGIQQQGIWGGIAALTGFLLPSVLLLIFAAYGISLLPHDTHMGWIHGLKLAVVAVVAQAILNMIKHFCTDIPRILITLVATGIALYETSFIGQLSVIILGAVAGKIFISKLSLQSKTNTNFAEKAISLRTSSIAWVLFLLVLFGLPLLNAEIKSHYLELFNSFYQTGALVFGGGHVVLPLLQSKLVLTGWVDSNTFLAGYGIAQAVPGPLFSFAAFLGTVIGGAYHGWTMGLLCVFAIYLPSFLILIGILPLWEKWRHYSAFKAALAGISAAVIGLLIAAFYNPVWIDSVQSYTDISIVILAFILLEIYRWPQWLIVLLCVATGLIFMWMPL